MKELVIYPHIEIKRYSIDRDTCEITDNNTGTIVNEFVDSNGYRCVILRDINNKRKNISVARIYAMTFKPKTCVDLHYNRNIVHFKDFNRKNITIDNLVWINNIELWAKTNVHTTKPKRFKDYLDFIGRLLERHYSIDDIISVLGLKNNNRTVRKLLKIIDRKIYVEELSKFKF